MGKVLQVHKIKQIGEALVAAGVSNLDDQASALGLCRSTTWSLLQAGHKHSGLSAGVVKTILTSPQLPTDVRSKVLEYVEEKISGRYGHAPQQISRFAARLGPLHANGGKIALGVQPTARLTRELADPTQGSAIKSPHARPQVVHNMLGVKPVANESNELRAMPRMRGERV